MADTRNRLWQYSFSKLHMLRIEEYANGAESLLVCPEAPDLDPAKSTSGGWRGGNAQHAYFDKGRFTSSYGFNGYLYDINRPSEGDPSNPGGKQYGGGDAAFDRWWGSYVGDVTEATTTPVFGDCNKSDAWAHDTDPAPPTGSGEWFQGGSIYNGVGNFAMDRHPGVGVNLSFVDGHAESVSATNLWQETWNAEFQPKDMPLNW